MPIEYLDTDIQDTNTGYICCFPSISLKEAHVKEVTLQEIYEVYPHANYYKQHATDASNRKSPGSCHVYPPKEGQTVGIINMYIHIYPIIRTFPNDNHTLRLKWFVSALEQLQGTYNLQALHMKLLSGTDVERRDYVTALEDFMSNYKLSNRIELDIYLHDEVLVTEKQPIKIKVEVEVEVGVGVGSPKQVVADVKYKLNFTENQICDGTLYESDFSRFSVDTEIETLGIMHHFPPGWPLLSSDATLIDKAKKVDIGLVGLEGEIFPPLEEIFNAFSYVQNNMPKVIILGQDPYHKKGQAHGLSFSVKKGVSIPPSLRNIYKALDNDSVDFTIPKHGCLTSWAQQGVILLNSALTVEEGKAGSHAALWESFTDHLIKLIATKYKNLIFVLWGGPAQKKKKLIGSGHTILEFNHPSPMVRNNKFPTECTHFSMINKQLEKLNKTPINWQLTE